MNSNPLHINKESEFIGYPIVFYPIFKERIWGGNKLESIGKSIPNHYIGESWEASMVGDDVSIVKNGVYQYTAIDVLVAHFPEKILGAEIVSKYGNQFPLLFKFLDAKTDLSIQLHPNDALAKIRHNSFGKTEMWYIMEADKDARIILGFNKNSSAEEYVAHLENKTLPSILKEYKVKKGDVFFIETGTVHAIGGGILLAEIQQPSDITYRIYDWDRVDSDGNPRELHVDLALEAIDYTAKETKVFYDKEINKSNKLVHCSFFKTNLLPLDEIVEKQKEDKFYVYICTEGNFEVIYNNESYQFNTGDTVLIPACIQSYTLKGKANLLEIYI